MRTMTAAELEQVTGGAALKGVMNTIQGDLRGHAALESKEVSAKARGVEGEGLLPWTPPVPTPCGGEHHICRPIL